MKKRNRITSEQIAEAMRDFAGTVQQLPPEVALRRSSVGFHPSQTQFEEVSGFVNVKVELLDPEVDQPQAAAAKGV